MKPLPPPLVAVWVSVSPAFDKTVAEFELTVKAVTTPLPSTASTVIVVPSLSVMVSSTA
ncbi:MAG: hypothetical protein GTO22_11705 [Gemmatimonadales bacterium]|nr:hypothetical protein [Gemmatimonadales bacterium]